VPRERTAFGLSDSSVSNSEPRAADRIFGIVDKVVSEEAQMETDFVGGKIASRNFGLCIVRFQFLDD
jgi:hypothetical protein